VIFTLVITLSVGIIEKPMPSDLACTQALFGAMAMAAAHPDARFISAKCKREQA
jgi:hypothetical protein